MSCAADHFDQEAVLIRALSLLIRGPMGRRIIALEALSIFAWSAAFAGRRGSRTVEHLVALDAHELVAFQILGGLQKPMTTFDRKGINKERGDTGSRLPIALTHHREQSLTSYRCHGISCGYSACGCSYSGCRY